MDNNQGNKENLIFKQRAKQLVSQMTLEEKIFQMMHLSPAIKRLNIPAYGWWNEALHGIARAGVATVFPQAIGLAATFDEALIYKAADVISTEGRAKYNEAKRHGDRGTFKGLTFWSPNVNIFRDPRWGRGHETYGEDPYLTARIAVAYIKGLQGNHPKYLKAAACAKHFAVHSGPEGIRHSFNSQVTDKDLYDTYLPAFEACVKEAKVEAVMGAYNCVNGEPCCGSPTLLQKILRDDWGFEGHVVSDCGAIADFHGGHSVTHTMAESAALAVNSGCDLNCGSCYTHLLSAVNQGLIDVKTIDQSVERLLTTRLKLGIINDVQDNPYDNIPYEVVDSKENNKLSGQCAEKSFVLLKNNGLLPLQKDKYRTIAVIGPNADNRETLKANYCGTASQYFTVLDGIREYIGKKGKVIYAQGCHLYKDRVEVCAEPGDRFAEAVSAAERSDAVVLCLGLDPFLEGEEGDASNEYGSGDKPDLNLPGLQQELMQRIYETGKPVILVILAGSALNLKWADENIPAIIDAGYPGAQGGRAVARLIFGEYSPAGRLPVTFYHSAEELPDFEDYSMKGRTYRYIENDVLYPFGFGLSYTHFEYSNLTLDKTAINQDESVTCTVTVKNTGNFSSDEVVQLYIKYDEACATDPKYQLRNFKRVFIIKGQCKAIRFEIKPSDLMLVKDNGQKIIEPGNYTVFAGGSQPDDRSSDLLGYKCLSTKLEFMRR
jgi:beta-glucosidase